MQDTKTIAVGNRPVFAFHIKRIVEEVYSVEAENRENALAMDLEDPFSITVIKQTARKLNNKTQQENG